MLAGGTFLPRCRRFRFDQPHQNCQPGPRAIDPALHGPDCAFEGLRGLLVGQAVRPHEQDRSALIGGKLGQCGLQILDGEPVVLIGNGDQGGGMVAVRILDLTSFGAMRGEEAVPKDREKPGLHVCAFLEALPARKP